MLQLVRLLWVYVEKKTFLECVKAVLHVAHFRKLLPISSSAEEETTVFRVLYYVKIGPFGVGVPLDGVHPKTSPFSTNDIILVNYKVVSQLSQLIFISFSYLNSSRHNSVIEFVS